MRSRLLLYGVIGLVTLASLGGVTAYSLFQNLCFPLANGTPCINWTGTYYTFTDINVSSDGNNYPTTLSVNNTGNNFTIQLGRAGLSTLLANFEVNASGGGNTYNYASNITFNNGTSINITGNSTNVTIGIPNLETCSPTTEYSVWNGSHWRCENDNDGTTYTFTNTDTFINISGTPAVNINANITSFDLRYVLSSIYNAFVSAIYTNTTNLQNANVTTNARIDSLNTTIQTKGSGNITGILVSGEGVYAYNSTELRTNNVHYVQPGNATDINTQITACVSGAGCRVIIPPGTYAVNATINLVNRTHVTLEGSGLDTRLVVSSGANLNQIINVEASSYSTVKGLYIEGSKSTQTGGQGIGILVNRSARFTIQDIYLSNTFNQSVYIVGNASASSSHASRINNIQIRDSGGTSFYFGPFSYDSSVIGVWIGESAYRGIEIYSGAQFFSNLHVWGSAEDGVFVRSDVNKFTNCYIESNDQDGLDAFYSQRTIMSSCYIWNNINKGLQLQETGYSTITNNVIKDNGGEGINLDDAIYTTVTNNIIDNNNYGIKADRLNYSVFSSNIVIFNTQAFVSNNGFNNSFIGNEIGTNNFAANINGTNINVLATRGVNNTLDSSMNVSSQIYSSEFCLNNDCITSWPSSAGNVTGGGTASYLPKWINSTNLGNSNVYESNGNIGINTTSPISLFHLSSSGANSGLITFDRPGTGNLTITNAGGTPTTIRYTLQNTASSAIPLFMVLSSSGNFSLGDIFMSSSGSNSNPAFFYDHTAQRIGIKTNYPLFDLDVNGSANISNILYTPQLCLDGDCRTAWPTGGGADYYANVTALQGSNATAFLKLDGLYSNVTNLQAVYNYSLDRSALLGNVTSLNATKAGIGSVNCASGTLLQNLTLSSTGITGECYTDQTGGGGATEWTNWTTVRYNSTSATSWVNMTNLTTTLSASTNYLIDCTFLTYANLVGTGEQLQVNFTGTPTNVTLSYNSQVSATTRTSYQGRSSTQNIFSDTGSAGTNILDLSLLSGRVKTGGSASTVTYFTKTEVAGNATAVEEGSWCTYKVLT